MSPQSPPFESREKKKKVNNLRKNLFSLEGPVEKPQKSNNFVRSNESAEIKPVKAVE